MEIAQQFKSLNTSVTASGSCPRLCCSRGQAPNRQAKALATRAHWLREPKRASQSSSLREPNRASQSSGYESHEPDVRDGQKWKHDGVQPRSHKLVDRAFSQAAYIKDGNKDDKKYVLRDPLNGVQVVHYRHKVNAEKVKVGKSSQNKTSIVEKIQVLKSSKNKTSIVEKIKVWKSSQKKTSNDEKIKVPTSSQDGTKTSKDEKFKVPKSSQNKTSIKGLDKDLIQDKAITLKATSPHTKGRPA